MAENVIADFAAGYVSGVAGLLVGSPLDVLKLRLQTEASERRISVTRGLVDLLHEGGLPALFRGVGSPIVGLAGLNAILFASYGGIMRYFEDQHRENNLTLAAKARDAGLQHHETHTPALMMPAEVPFRATYAQYYAAGFGAGLASFLITTPSDLVKLRAQGFHGPTQAGRSLKVARHVLRTEGLRGFYRGSWVTLLRDAPSYGIYFMVYEAFKDFLKADGTSSYLIDSAKLLTAGGMAGVIGWVSIYPLDVIKSRLQVQSVSNNAQQEKQMRHPHLAKAPCTPITPKPITNGQVYKGIIDCAIKSYRQEGLQVFGRGLGATIIRAFPVNAVTFFVYEVMMELYNTMYHSEKVARADDYIK
ncbi:hypothetical protein BZG36_03134 [Bifiguratus adelaidae]|uniref:Mitochondrial carrier protein n=1 Tax=Bifiguratus adelaidae TaxID=1938954 RepID=A0A261XXB7_9FUNG|nr:hypothetical protein BZG36_03134 [Bifiguratus adelaidae]